MVQPLLLLLLMPLLGILGVLLLDRERGRFPAIAATGIALALSAYLFINSLTPAPMLGGYSYLPQLNVSIAFSAGPIPALLVLLSSLVLFIAVLSGNRNSSNRKLSNLLLLVFEAAAFGIFLSTSLFSLFIFWELATVAMFFMIGILGSSNRKAASLKFLVYQLFAGAMLLFAVLLLLNSPLHTTDLASVMANSGLLSHSYQLLIFISLMLAFGINLPLFPLHLWFPDAHTEAPTEGSMALAGVFTKFGCYGLLLLFQLLPVARYAPYVAALAIVSALYSSLVLMRQRDLKRLVAYTTMVGMGVLALGITTMTQLGYAGAAFGMFAQGITIALMFLLVGSLQHMFGERDLRALSGLASSAKAEFYGLLYGTFALVGLPTTATFVAEIFIFTAAYGSFGLYSLVMLVPIGLMGAYLYYALERLGTRTPGSSRQIDTVSGAQRAGYLLLALSIALLGLLPFLLMGVLHGA